MTGRVIRAKGKVFIVFADGLEYSCEIFGKAKREQGHSPVVVGDIVDFTAAADRSGGIEKVHERKTKFSRPKIAEEGTEQVIVSNVDQMVIVASVREPELKTGLIDRFIVAAFKGGLTPIVVINKIDLQPKDDLDRIKGIYESVEIPIVLASCIDGKGVESLKALLKDHESIFVGHSGTGKSTLLNLIQPGLGLRTSEISESTSKGTHTTTAVELYALDNGGYVVDSPGLKVLGLWHIDKTELHEYFPEFQRYLGSCKFSRCSHLHEPQCAVMQALNNGDIYSERYESYRKIYRSLS